MSRQDDVERLAEALERARRICDCEATVCRDRGLIASAYRPSRATIQAQAEEIAGLKKKAASFMMTWIHPDDYKRELAKVAALEKDLSRAREALKTFTHGHKVDCLCLACESLAAPEAR